MRRDPHGLGAHAAPSCSTASSRSSRSSTRCGEPRRRARATRVDVSSGVPRRRRGRVRARDADLMIAVLPPRTDADRDRARRPSARRWSRTAITRWRTAATTSRATRGATCSSPCAAPIRASICRPPAIEAHSTVAPQRLRVEAGGDPRRHRLRLAARRDDRQGPRGRQAAAHPVDPLLAARVPPSPLPPHHARPRGTPADRGARPRVTVLDRPPARAVWSHRADRGLHLMHGGLPGAVITSL